ncbi:hypothetical protein AGMMS49992_28730 [Clostridia bacterium]|nr:hypothetical protein AGMMS49992_28730 [Clostridia bacterium]
MDWNVENLALAAAFLSGMSLAMGVVLLALVVRLNRRVQSLEGWLARELARVHDGIDSLHRLLADYSPHSPRNTVNNAQPLPTQQPGSQLPAVSTGGELQPHYLGSPYAPPRRPSQLNPATERAMSAHGKELIQAVNNLLVSNQPFNFSDALQEGHPRLTLVRMSPRGSPDLWSSTILLDPGGDGYFAWVDNNRAYLFPNYDRFSTTHDPKLLFDGARLDSRIAAMMRPAVLTRSSDGAWQLSEKGQVQMR